MKLADILNLVGDKRQLITLLVDDEYVGVFFAEFCKL